LTILQGKQAWSRCGALQSVRRAANDPDLHADMQHHSGMDRARSIFGDPNDGKKSWRPVGKNVDVSPS
jgi:hypothetical protein